MQNLKEKIQYIVEVFKKGNLIEAEEASKELIRTNPNIGFLYNLLGLIFAQQNKIDLAIETYEKGIKNDPNFALLYNNLGLVYFNNKNSVNIKKAEELYKKSITIDINNPEPHNNLGTLFSSRSQYEKAESCYKKAISIKPLAISYYNLGSLYITTGNFSEAKKNLLESIKLNPKFVRAHRSLSRITNYKKDTSHLKLLETINNKLDKNDEDSKVDMSFALGKAYEDIENFSKSFNFYQEANSLYKKKIKFILNDEKKKFNEIKNTFNISIFDKYKKFGNKKDEPIFIVGMPRSGTTLIEQIISSHPDVFGCDETETIPYLATKYFKNNNMKLFFENIVEFTPKTLKKIGDEYVLKMQEFSNNSKRTTDKLPINFLSIGFIKLILPNAKIIHCQRDPKDNVLSIFKNHFPGQRVNFAYDLSDIVEYYNLYKNLMNFWNKNLNKFIYNVKYENLILNSEGEIKRLLKYCNLEWSDKCLSFYNNKRPVKTASDYQSRNKIYSSSIGSWKNFDKFLAKSFVNLET
jgi:tetratricopeptide (TPR) repeat protein